jgi:hypothetical protein
MKALNQQARRLPVQAASYEQFELADLSGADFWGDISGAGEVGQEFGNEVSASILGLLRICHDTGMRRMFNAEVHVCCNSISSVSSP